MAAVILDGRALAERVLREVAPRATDASRKLGRRPRLAVILVSPDERARRQADLKRRCGTGVGVDVRVIEKAAFPPMQSGSELLGLINELNSNADVDAIFLQLPLPDGWDELKFSISIQPGKDVDPTHAELVGKDASLRPFSGCTAEGMMRLLEHHRVEIAGKSALLIFGTPWADLPFVRDLRGHRVAISRTRYSAPAESQLRASLAEADLVITAMGLPHYLRAGWVKPGAVVIDAAYSGGPVGDVDPGVLERAGYFAPVPGGVGPMTVAMLMEHTIRAAERSAEGH